MHPLQEKFQVIVPTPPEDGEQWVSFERVRDLGPNDAWQGATSVAEDPRKFNMMPPGMDISNQLRTEQRNQPLSMAGATDVSQDANPRAFAEGYTKRKMRGSDDLYTGEHVDHFYGDAGGFSERNNYLDRI